jgi:chaperonin GroEL
MKKGTKHTAETIQKMRESHKGQKAWNKGKPSPWMAVDNGRTLCKSCHEKTSTYRNTKVNIESVSNIRPNPLEGLARGIRKCAEIVGPTMGPAGKNVILEEKLEPKHQIVNDGALIISRMEFKDELEKIGHGFLREATERSNQVSGDGSSSTVVVLNALLQERIATDIDISPMKLKQELDECLPIIEALIDSQTKVITPKDIRNVAQVAGEDEEIAHILQEIYQNIGKEGFITLENSNTNESSFSLIEGVQFEGTGFLSQYMVNDEESRKKSLPETKAIYYNPTILVTKRKFNNLTEANLVLRYLAINGVKDLVIFTDDMDSEVAASLIAKHLKTRSGIEQDFPMRVLIIKAPVLWKNFVFEDFAKIVGATIVEDASGISFKNLELKHLGSCEKLEVDKDNCKVIGIKDISAHLKDLHQEGTNDAKRRIAWLSTKTAKLFLGAKSESELSYRKFKCEDAIFSSQLALKGGIVSGGGLALLNASRILPDTVGGQLLKQALKAPILQIQRNAGYGVEATDTLAGGEFGFNASTKQMENLMETGIVDAALIVKGVVRNSISIASTMLTTHACLVIPPPSQEELLNKAIMKPMNF